MKLDHPRRIEARERCANPASDASGCSGNTRPSGSDGDLREPRNQEPRNRPNGCRLGRPYRAHRASVVVGRHADAAAAACQGAGHRLVAGRGRGLRRGPRRGAPSGLEPRLPLCRRGHSADGPSRPHPALLFAWRGELRRGLRAGGPPGAPRGRELLFGRHNLSGDARPFRRRRPFDR